MVASSQQGHAIADDLDPAPRQTPLMRRDPMAVESAPARWDPQIRRAPGAAGLYDILDLILDKGIVIDAFVRVSLVGIEVLTLDARVVIASVDTYLRYAEGVERMGLENRSGSKKLPDMVGQGAKSGAMAYGAKKLGNAIKGGSGDDDEGQDKDEGDDEDNESKEGLGHALTRGVRHILQKGVGGILHNVKGDWKENDEDDGGEGDDEHREQGDREPQRQAQSSRSQKGGSVGRSKAGSK